MSASVYPPSIDQSDRRSSRFEEIYRRSIAHPEEFWAEAAADIDWVEPWSQVLAASRPPFYRWFTSGQLNICYNALDRHVEHGRADQVALVYDSPVTDTRKKFTYRELRDEVALFAGALRRLGVERGDRVAIAGGSSLGRATLWMGSCGSQPDCLRQVRRVACPFGNPLANFMSASGGARCRPPSGR
jgi:non-ribosomal peptide synthetase component F